jgi:hypothetical protein
VVNTVTTLGATFSTTGAKLAITPGCIGGVCCAIAENVLVDAQSNAPLINPKDRKIPLCINVSLQENRTLDGRRPLFAHSNDNEVERVVLNALVPSRELASLFASSRAREYQLRVTASDEDAESGVVAASLWAWQ